MAFSDKLKQLREEHGLSQAALAKQIYVSRSAVAKWENGLGLPDDGNLLALCDYFNVKEEWLMEREDLKKQLRIDKKQLGHILLCAGGILVPALAVCDDLRGGTQSTVPIFPRDERRTDRVLPFRRSMGGDGGVFRARPCPARTESQKQAVPLP